ncbi:MAG: FGGY-family carbohydrate kinase [Thermoproteota archaeon]
MYIGGLDVGTIGCKFVIFTENGSIVSSAYREYPLEIPKPGWLELNPKIVWRKIVETVREALNLSKIDPEELVSLAVSAQGEAFIPIGKDGEVLYNSIATSDSRAKAQTEWLGKKFGAWNLFKLTGHVLFPVFTLNKILWIKENMPKVFGSTKKFLLWEDYVNWKLCGRAAIDHSLACRTMMYDISKREWSEEILGTCGIDRDLLSEIHPSGSIVGNISVEASHEVGFSQKTCVVTGGHDQACGSLGAGVVEPGPIYNVAGTVECCMPAVEKPILTENMFGSGCASYPHVVPGKYLILAYNANAGLILRWFRDNLAIEERMESQRRQISAYKLLDEAAEKVPQGASKLIFLPYFTGATTPNWNSEARGIIFGLALHHGRAEIFRAILEGLAYELRYNLEKLIEGGVKVTELRSVGGGARSPLWLQLKADVSGVKVVVPDVSEASSLGAALLAGTGVGVYRSVHDASRTVYRVRASYEPNILVRDTYDRYYKLYKRVYSSLKESFSELSRI